MSRAVCVVALAVAMAGACGAHETEPERTGGDEQLPRAPGTDTEPEADEPEPPVLAPLEPSSVCGRAQACCRAFVEVTPNARLGAACAGPAEASALEDDEACERMRRGWAQVLALRADVEAPGACALNPSE